MSFGSKVDSLVGNSVGDEHDGLVAVGTDLRVVEAVPEQLKGHGQGRGEVGDLLGGDLLYGLLELPDVLVRRLQRNLVLKNKVWELKVPHFLGASRVVFIKKNKSM